MEVMKCLLAVATGLSLQAYAQGIVLGDFTKGDGGWKAAHHLKDVVVSEKGTSFTVTDNDPWFLGPKIAMPAATEGATKVRFTITCAPTTCAGAWEVYHDLEGKGYDAPSDEITHTGRGIDLTYIERN